MLRTIRGAILDKAYQVYQKNATSEFPKKSTLQFLSIKDSRPLGTTSFSGYLLLGSKDPGGRWSRDLLKSSRFLISVVLSIWEG